MPHSIQYYSSITALHLPAKRAHCGMYHDWHFLVNEFDLVGCGTHRQRKYQECGGALLKARHLDDAIRQKIT